MEDKKAEQNTPQSTNNSQKLYPDTAVILIGGERMKPEDREEYTNQFADNLVIDSTKELDYNAITEFGKKLSKEGIKNLQVVLNVHGAKVKSKAEKSKGQVFSAIQYDPVNFYNLLRCLSEQYNNNVQVISLCCGGGYTFVLDKDTQERFGQTKLNELKSMPSIQSGSSCYSAYEDLGDGKILVHATSLIPTTKAKVMITTTRMCPQVKAYFENKMKIASQTPAFKSASFCQAALHNEVVCFEGKYGYYSRIPTKYIGNQPAYDWAGRILYDWGRRSNNPVYYEYQNGAWHRFDQQFQFMNTGIKHSYDGKQYNRVPEVAQRHNYRNPYAYNPSQENSSKGQQRNRSSIRVAPEPDAHKKPRNVSLKHKTQKGLSIDS